MRCRPEGAALPGACEGRAEERPRPGQGPRARCALMAAAALPRELPALCTKHNSVSVTQLPELGVTPPADAEFEKCCSDPLPMRAGTAAILIFPAPRRE